METVTLTMVWQREYEREARLADRDAWWYDMPKRKSLRQRAMATRQMVPGLRHPAAH